MLRGVSAILLVLVAGCATQRHSFRSYRPAPNLHDRTEGLYLYGDAGFGLPVGLVGLGLGLSPARWAAFELGAGLNDAGPQGSGMASVRLRTSHDVTLGLASGVSIGVFDDDDPGGPLDEYPHEYEKTWDWVLWSNHEFQVRGALSETTAMRGHFGVTFPFGAAVASCRPGRVFDRALCLESELPSVLLYVGVGAEYDL